MADDPLIFRDRALSTLTDRIGCYILADLDDTPIYVGQSVDGIRSRVRRHLSSARSDIVANRQIDVWEVAFVWAFPTKKEAIPTLEATLFHYFDQRSQLMNGSVPKAIVKKDQPPEPDEKIAVLSRTDIAERSSPEIRLPRQATHYARLVDHYLVVKKSSQIARAMNAHFERLTRYHAQLLEKK